MFSHAFVGYIAGKGLRLDKKLLITLVISCTVLDMDTFAGIAGLETVFEFHRGPVHSFFSAFFISLIIAAIYVGYMHLPSKKMVFISLMCLAGLYGHLFLDLLTSWGTEVLWPFSTKRLTLSLTPFLDPLFFAVLVSASVLLYVKENPKTAKAIAFTALILSAADFGFHYYERGVAVDTVKELYSTNLDMVSVPAFLPNTWWVAAKVPAGDGYTYEIYSVDSFDKKVLASTRVESPFVNYSGPAEPPIDSPEKAVEYSKRDEKVASYIEEIRLPAVDVTFTDGVWHVFWYDVSSQMNEGGVHSGMVAQVGEDGTLVAAFSIHYPFSREGLKGHQSRVVHSRCIT